MFSFGLINPVTFITSSNFAIEINMLGLTTNRQYPKLKIFELAREIGNKVLIGLDAHSPSQISTNAFELGRLFAKKAGVEIIEDLGI